MSLLYPIGLIQEVDIDIADRTLIDEFEAGNTATRSYWGAQNFKRIFTVTHAPLTRAEWKYLRSFYHQRGTWDSFWFRNNVDRTGNALVRFSQLLSREHTQALVTLGKKYVNLAEIAPIRNLPEFDEVTAAAGNAPVLWYDANREYYLQHCGSVILDPAAAAWDVMENYPALWQAGSNLNLGNILGQYQSYNFTGVEWAKTGANISQLGGSIPACTIFIITRQSTNSSSAKWSLFSAGTATPNYLLGFQLDASNNFSPWVGGTESYSSLKSNSPANTWRSFAVAWPASSGVDSFYCNGALIGTDTQTRATFSGPAALGASVDGSKICNPSNGAANSNIGHVLVFNAALTLAQIKALHNMLGYQYGLAPV